MLYIGYSLKKWIVLGVYLSSLPIIFFITLHDFFQVMLMYFKLFTIVVSFSFSLFGNIVIFISFIIADVFCSWHFFEIMYNRSLILIPFFNSYVIQGFLFVYFNLMVSIGKHV